VVSRRQKPQKPLPKDVQMFNDLTDLMEVDGWFIMEAAAYSGKTGRGEIHLISVADRRKRLRLDVQISPMHRRPTPKS
jgi:hypothetical protein